MPRDMLMLEMRRRNSFVDANRNYLTTNGGGGTGDVLWNFCVEWWFLCERKQRSAGIFDKKCPPHPASTIEWDDEVNVFVCRTDSFDSRTFGNDVDLTVGFVGFCPETKSSLTRSRLNLDGGWGGTVGGVSWWITAIGSTMCSVIVRSSRSSWTVNGATWNDDASSSSSSFSVSINELDDGEVFLVFDFARADERDDECFLLDAELPKRCECFEGDERFDDETARLVFDKRLERRDWSTFKNHSFDLIDFLAQLRFSFQSFSTIYLTVVRVFRRWRTFDERSRPSWTRKKDLQTGEHGGISNSEIKSKT